MKVHLNKSLRKQFEDIGYFLKKTEEIIEKLGANFSWIEFENLYFNRQFSDITVSTIEPLNIIQRIQNYKEI